MHSRTKSPHIFISAGEASGDLHGSNLVRALKSAAPEARISCLGGPMLEKAGATVIVNNRDISVTGGIAEIFSHVRAIYSSLRKVRSHFISDPPDLVVLIDFPDYNFLLARFAKKAGARIFYYISPQVWAWRESRVKTLKRLVDRMAVILPFEKSFYQSHHMNVDYVGHPLVDVLCGITNDPAQSARKYRAGVKGPLVGILPGSRRSELKLLFDMLLDSAGIIRAEFPEAEFIIPAAPSLDVEEIERRALQRHVPVRIVSGDTYGVIAACDLLLTSSGTVTLEAAIIGTPMIITYRLSRISAEIGIRLLRDRKQFFGLPNVIAGRQVAPEFIHDDARPELLAAQALRHLKNPELLDCQRREFRKIRDQLGEPGISERVARLVLQTLEETR